MPAVIHCDSIGKAFGSLTVLDGLSLSIGADDRIGVIGPNGAGKSTLLKILAGEETIDDGRFFKAKEARVSYVPQFEEFDESCRALEWLNRRLTHKGDHMLGRPNAVLRQLGFTDPEVPIRQLSGGWRKRLLLGGGLLNESDIVLFDEPTNHLDLEGILWFERLLQRPGFAWVMVTHDRRLLDKAARRVVEINPCYPGHALESEGGYQSFCRRREVYLSMQQNRKESAATKLRREEEWLSRSPKARTGKSKYRAGQVDELRREVQEAASALTESSVAMDLQASGRRTKRLIELDGVSFSYDGSVVIKDVTVFVHKRQRIGLLGKNGSGKTTLLRLLHSDLDPEEGSITQAPNLETVYFSQHRAELDQERSVRRTLAESGDTVVVRGTGVHVASWAARFGFDAASLDAPVSALSGGERARLLIARLVLQPADVLLLDEPTNDLDLQTIEALESNLKEFAGAVVLVSHDRMLLEEICGHYYGIDEEGRVERYGSFSQWEQQVLLGSKKKKEPAKPIEKPQPGTQQRKRTYLEQKEYEAIEGLVAEAEERASQLTEQLSCPEVQTDAEKLQALYKERERAQAEVDALYARWEKLEKLK